MLLILLLKNQSCGLPECTVDGLHAHHPRNCLYYLRDWDVVQLQQLLNRNDKKFDTATPKDHDGKIIEKIQIAENMTYCFNNCNVVASLFAVAQ